MDKDYRSLEEIRNSYKKPNKEELSKKYLEDSKKRFIKILETKMKTTFIGALSEFERKFGFMWGDDNYNSNNIAAKQLKECLEKNGFGEEIWREIWQEARDRILTNGNNQLKAMMNELETYTLHWNRYRMDLKVLPEGMSRQEFINKNKEEDNG